MINNGLHLVKIGGSLMEPGKPLSDLVNFLTESSGNGAKIIITTGSRDLSDRIRQCVKDITGGLLPEEDHVEITMKSRDIITTAFARLDAKFKLVDSLERVSAILENGGIPVILQHGVLKDSCPNLIGRGISTDTTSAYFAKALGVDKFIKLTNVDGVFESLGSSKNPLPKISTIDLSKKGVTCVDGRLACYLQDNGQECFVLNGQNIPNLRNFLRGGNSVYTRIYPLN